MVAVDALSIVEVRTWLRSIRYITCFIFVVYVRGFAVIPGDRHADPVDGAGCRRHHASHANSYALSSSAVPSPTFCTQVVSHGKYTHVE